MHENKPQKSFFKVYQGAKFEILKDGSQYYIRVYDQGVAIGEINDALEKYSIQIDNFKNLQTALNEGTGLTLLFGSEKDKIIITVTSDEMKAYTRFLMTEEELKDKKKLVNDINKILYEKGIIYGINLEKLMSDERILPDSKLIVAEGDYPVSGQSSKVTTYNFSQGKPKIKDDGSVDHLEVGLINQVNKGDWLGEWTKPTEGKDGINIKGKIVKAPVGLSHKIPYNTKTIHEVDKGDKICLYANIGGALKFDKSGALDITDHLTLDNVNYSTGNVNFNGSVTITGTIADGFSVIALEDIEVLGVEGIGCVNEVISKRGNIFISGGINGKGKSVINGISVYSRFISNANIYARKTVCAKSYILNSYVEAKEVLMENQTAVIAGSHLKDVSYVVTGSLGNESETKTTVEIQQIDRIGIEKKQIEIRKMIQENTIEITKLDRVVKDNSISSQEKSMANSLRAEISFLLEMLEKENKILTNLLEINATACVVVKKMVYPGVNIITNSDQKLFIAKTKASTIFEKNGKIVISNA